MATTYRELIAAIPEERVPAATLAALIDLRRDGRSFHNTRPTHDNLERLGLVELGAKRVRNEGYVVALTPKGIAAADEWIARCEARIRQPGRYPGVPRTEWHDQLGRRISMGDRVVPIGHLDACLWSKAATVVGFGTTRVVLARGTSTDRPRVHPHRLRVMPSGT